MMICSTKMRMIWSCDLRMMNAVGILSVKSNYKLSCVVSEVLTTGPCA